MIKKIRVRIGIDAKGKHCLNCKWQATLDHKLMFMIYCDLFNEDLDVDYSNFGIIRCPQCVKLFGVGNEM